MLGKKYLSFQDCSFSMRKGRESTARVVVAKELGILNSYTLEGTFAGPNFGPLKDTHMNGNHFQEMGHALCDSILDYYIPNRESGLLNDEAGIDGISLSAKCAHSIHKHAKISLRRYAMPGENHDDDGSGALGSLEGRQLDGSNKNSSSSGNTTGDGDGNTGLNKGRKSINGSLIEGGNNDNDDDDGNESPNEDKDDSGGGAPPSPEVLAVATESDGSPSNTKVLEALLSDECSKDAKRRRSSANSKINSGCQEIDIIEDDECDDIDSGSDGGGDEFDDNGSVSESQTPLGKLDLFNNDNLDSEDTSNVLADTAEMLSACEQVDEIIEEELIYSVSNGGGVGVSGMNLLNNEDDMSNLVGVSSSFDTSLTINNSHETSLSSNRRSFRRHSSTSSRITTSVSNSNSSLTAVPSSSPDEHNIVYPQLVPSSAPGRNNTSHPPPAFSTTSSESGSVLLPRSIARGGSGGNNSESMWAGGGGASGGGGSFWADAVNENGMVPANNKRPSLLSVGSNADGTALRPRSGSRYRQQLNHQHNTVLPVKGLTLLGFEQPVSSGLPAVGSGNNNSGLASSHSVGEIAVMSRPLRSNVRASSNPMGGSSASVGASTTGSVSITASRATPPLGISPRVTNSNIEDVSGGAAAEEDGPISSGGGKSKGSRPAPKLSSGAAQNVMRGSLRVKDTPTALLAPGTSPKIPKNETMTTSQKLSFRR